MKNLLCKVNLNYNMHQSIIIIDLVPNIIRNECGSANLSRGLLSPFISWSETAKDHRRVLLKNLHLNGQTIGFHPQVANFCYLPVSERFYNNVLLHSSFFFYLTLQIEPMPGIFHGHG